MKKSLLLLISCVIIFMMFTGCGKDNQEVNTMIEEDMEEKQEERVISEELGDEQIDVEEKSVDVNPEDIGKTFVDGDYEYLVLEDGTAKLTYYSGSETIVNIPEMVGKYNVSVIGKACFTHELTDDKEITRTNIEEIIVPGCIKEIEEFGINLPHGNLKK